MTAEVRAGTAHDYAGTVPAGVVTAVLYSPLLRHTG